MWYVSFRNHIVQEQIINTQLNVITYNIFTIQVGFGISSNVFDGDVSRSTIPGSNNPFQVHREAFSCYLAVRVDIAKVQYRRVIFYSINKHNSYAVTIQT